MLRRHIEKEKYRCVLIERLQKILRLGIKWDGERIRIIFFSITIHIFPYTVVLAMRWLKSH